MAHSDSAYQKLYYTKTTQKKVQSDLLSALDLQMCVMLLMLDTFNTVDHQTLIHRLDSRFGITGSVFKLIESYLSD